MVCVYSVSDNTVLYMEVMDIYYMFKSYSFWCFQVASYMNSSIFENKLKCLESMKGTADSIKSTQSSLLTKWVLVKMNCWYFLE